MELGRFNNLFIPEVKRQHAKPVINRGLTINSMRDCNETIKRSGTELKRQHAKPVINRGKHCMYMHRLLYVY